MFFDLRILLSKYAAFYPKMSKFVTSKFTGFVSQRFMREYTFDTYFKNLKIIILINLTAEKLDFMRLPAQNAGQTTSLPREKFHDARFHAVSSTERRPNDQKATKARSASTTS